MAKQITRPILAAANPENTENLGFSGILEEFPRFGDFPDFRPRDLPEISRVKKKNKNLFPTIFCNCFDSPKTIVNSPVTQRQSRLPDRFWRQHFEKPGKSLCFYNENPYVVRSLEIIQIWGFPRFSAERPPRNLESEEKHK